MTDKWLSSHKWLLLAIACLVYSCDPPRQGVEHNVDPAQSIPISAGVEHVSNPDGQSSTWVTFYVKKQFAEPLPEAIEKVTVTANGKPLPLSKSNFTYFPNRRLFWASIPGAPEIGDYNITVTSQTGCGTATDHQTTIFSIESPRPDNASPNATTPCTSNRPVFSWGAVNASKPMYFRLEIAPADGRPIYRSGDVADMLSIQIPDGVLVPGKHYRWRARCADSDKWREIQNRSQTPWIGFTTARHFTYEYQLPKRRPDGLEVGNLFQLKQNPKPLLDLCDQIINRNIENVHSILIIKDGRLVFEEYFRGHDADTKHSIASVTKSVVSLLVGMAIDKGFIPDVDQKVMDYFPDSISETNRAVWEPMRLHHLLTMSAGLDWDAITFPRDDPRQTTHQMYDSRAPIAFVFSRKALAEPGRVYNYNSGLTLLLGEIIKRATGTSADQFAREHLFKPLGISDFVWDRFENGVIAADGGLHLRPRDMAKIGLLVLNAGSHNERRIVSKSWIFESTRKHIFGNGVGYGYQWRRSTVALAGNQIDVVYASGLGGQRIFILPKLDVVTVITSKTHFNSGGGSKAERLFLESILPFLMNTEPADLKIIAMPLERMEPFVGRYKSKAAGHVGSVFLKDGKLYLEVEGKGTAELFFTGPDKCVGRIDGIGKFAIHMAVNENGLVDHARFFMGLRSFRLDKVK